MRILNEYFDRGFFCTPDFPLNKSKNIKIDNIQWWKMKYRV